MYNYILIIFLCKISSTILSLNFNMSSLFRKISTSKLGVSEPNPSWFGNRPNELNNTHWTNKNWLKSRFHFSFAEYNNPKNQNFGILRVMNDDLVQPDRGFGQHPHRDAEICTYVVNGHLTHKDSMGTQETLGRGSIQFMTAGTGVEHSEHNLDKLHPLRFIQMWITPRRRGLRPNYGSFSMQTCAAAVEDSDGDRESGAKLNSWHHLVSDVENEAVRTPVKINQDANIHVTEVFPGAQAEFVIHDGRQAYILCMEGSAIFTGTHGSEVLIQHEAAEVYGPNVLTVSTADSATSTHLLLVEMSYTGKGRTDL